VFLLYNDFLLTATWATACNLVPNCRAQGTKLHFSLPLCKKDGVQACEWIADCPIEGCTNQCQLSSQVGHMLIALEDAAWDLDWWQVCPELAMRTWRARRNTPESLATAPAGVGNFPCLL
jgi:hypothetical protein